MTIPPRPERRRMANTGFRVFRERIGESSRLAGLAIRLTWRASPRLVFGLLPLVVLRAALPSLELLLSKAVVDRAARDLGLGGQASALPPPVAARGLDRARGGRAGGGAARAAVQFDVPEPVGRPAHRLHHRGPHRSPVGEPAPRAERPGVRGQLWVSAGHCFGRRRAG